MTQHLRLVVFAPMWIGCATVLHGTTQQIRFHSIPPGAIARVGNQTVTTPGDLTLSRNSAYEVKFVKPGYIPTYGYIRQSRSEAVWGNLLLGGIGFFVDISNGAAYDLEPDTVSVMLLFEPTAAGKAANTSVLEDMPAAIPEQPPEPSKPPRSIENQ